MVTIMFDHLVLDHYLFSFRRFFSSPRQSFSGLRIFLTIVSLLMLNSIIASVSADETRQISLTYGADYKPFAWEEMGLAVGVQKDFVEAILVNELGIRVDQVACPWARCQIRVKEGEEDAFFTVPKAERAEYTIATDIPFYETRFLMHTSRLNKQLKPLSAVKSLKDLEAIPNIRHVHMLGSGWHKNALKDMKIVYTIPDASNIPVILDTQRADLYIEQYEMFHYQAKLHGLEARMLTFPEPQIRQLGWHLFIAKNSPALKLMPEINQKLKELKLSGRLEEIRKEIFSNYGLPEFPPETPSIQ